MKRPEIRLENYEEVYQYYRDHQPFTPTAKLGYYLMAKGMAPEVTYDDGAEDAIRDHLRAGGRFIMSPNHVLDLDQYTLAGLAHCIPLLRPLQTETFVLAKPKVFTDGWLQRRGVDTMGAIPVWRGKDIRDTPEKKDIRIAAGVMLAEVCHHRIVELGNHGAMFGEGERNEGNPLDVQDFMYGIANMIQAAEGVDIIPLPIGIRYPITDARIKRHPRVHIGNPIHGKPKDTEQSAALTQRLREEVQRCVKQTAFPFAA